MANDNALLTRMTAAAEEATALAQHFDDVISAAQNVIEWRHHNGPEGYESMMAAISHLEKLVGRSE